MTFYNNLLFKIMYHIILYALITKYYVFSYAVTENHLTLPAEPINVPIRTVTKYSRKKGKRQTVKTVLKRFYRLNW